MNRIINNRKVFKGFCLRTLKVFFFAFSFSWIASSTLYAATITVSTTEDSLANDSFCSLREALANADGDGVIYGGCEAGSGNDQVVLPAGVYCLSPNYGDLVIASSLEMTGAGVDSTIIDGGNGTSSSCAMGNEDRVMEISNAGIVLLQGVTIQNGAVTSSGGYSGGGVYVHSEDPSTPSSLTLDNVVLSGNSASTYGGGLYSVEATVVMTDSTVSGNFASLNGGGMYVGTSSSVSLTGSTVSGNNADRNGAGLYAFGSTLALNNSTVASNSSSNYGGGMYATNFASVTLDNSTVSANTANNRGGGLSSNANSTIRLKSTIVAGNTDLTSVNDDCYRGSSSTGSLIDSYGYNFIPQTTCMAACATGFDCATDVTDGLGLSLGALGNNGGSTETMALDADDTGVVDLGSCTTIDSTSVTVDQRNYNRDSTCDIGAFELSGTAPPPDDDSGDDDDDSGDDHNDDDDNDDDDTPPSDDEGDNPPDDEEEGPGEDDPEDDDEEDKIPDEETAGQSSGDDPGAVPGTIPSGFGGNLTGSGCSMVYGADAVTTSSSASTSQVVGTLLVLFSLGLIAILWTSLKTRAIRF